MKKMLFIVNPKAGKTTLKNSLVEVIDKFCKADFDVRIYLTQDCGDSARIAKEEGANYDLIVCAGGDGTLDNTVTGMMEGKIETPLGYIPCGSTNDFAKSLELTPEAENAADIVVSGKKFLMDVGKFNEDYFIYVAAFGIFSDVSYATPQNMKNMLGHSAYILQGIKSIVNIPSYHMVVDIDGEKVEGDYIYGMVSNSTSVGGFKSMCRHGVEFDDGLFEGILIEKIHNPLDLQRIITCLLSGDASDKNMVSFRAKHVIFNCDEDLPWTLDGEFGGSHKLTDISVCEKALNLIVANDPDPEEI